MLENEKKTASRAGVVIGNTLICLLLIGLVLTICQVPKAAKNASAKKALADSKVVLYEGPKSLRDATDYDLVRANETERDISLLHCTDTQITVNGEDLYVYDTNVNNTHTWEQSYHPALDRTPVTYFDFEGTVELKITVPNIPLNSVVVRPLKYGIEPEIDAANHTVTFKIDTPDNYTVEFNDSIKRAVHIFANPLETYVPDPEDKNVLYLGPGEWNAETINLKKNQTLYISGGAVLHGTVQGSYVNNVTVMGRGILDSSNLSTWGGREAHVVLSFNGCNNVNVEGVISLNSNCWDLQSYDCGGVNVDGLKMITCRPNGDGMSIQSSTSVSVQNSFIRAWDDALVVKNYSDTNCFSIKFDNCQIWSDLAQCMEIGYETNKGNAKDSRIHDVTFSNITVLHAFHKPVISIHNADNAEVSGITWKDITVEDADLGQGDGTFDLIDFRVLQNSGWSTTKDRGVIKDVLVENVNVIDGGDIIQEEFAGFDAEHKVQDITLRNVVVKGQKIDGTDKANFKVEKHSTDNIVVE